MNSLEYTKARVRAFLDELSRLQGSEFPYTHSEEALTQIFKALERHLGYLNRLSSASDPSTVKAGCRSAVTALVLYLPLLGFITRSTSVRNAFEVRGPLLRLARRFLDPSTRLILSSEWEYSPFTYMDIPVLKRFLLIGLPAPESSNPLLVALAGHELGHPVWRDRSVENTIAPLLERTLLALIQDVEWNDYSRLFSVPDKELLTTDLFAKQSWQPSYEWALHQCQETFCDFFALRTFGESYLNAFAFLLSPSVGGHRPFNYPNMRRRASNLVTAASRYDIRVSPDYAQLFEDLPEPSASEPQTMLLLSLADRASQSTIDVLAESAHAIVTAAHVALPSEKDVDALYLVFKQHVVPSANPGSLACILNAAWRAYHDAQLWADRPEIKDPHQTLREIILKSIEVLEFKQITEDTP